MQSPLASPTPSDAERRYLFAAGTAAYSGLPEEEQLPSVEADVREVVTLFTEMGYERILPELGINPRLEDLRTRLSGWFIAQDRRETDIVVLYFVGHGAPDEEGRHCLLTTESDLQRLAATALPTEDLARYIGRNVREVLVILNTCYSGQGAGDLTETARAVARSLSRSRAVSTGFHAITSASAKQEAEQNVFAPALVQAVKQPDRRAVGPGLEFQGLDLVVEAINRRFEVDERLQRAEHSAAGERAASRFLRNPHYVPMSLELDLATQNRLVERYRKRYREDLGSHFLPRAKGVEFEALPGWYFTGRVQVLKDLVAWLTAEQGDGKARVVTGKPGSGKSAVLSRLVTLSDPECRDRTPLDGVDAATIPLEKSIDIAIHARNRTLEEITLAIAAAVGEEASTPEELARRLLERKRPVRIVVDALDEASDPDGLARRLLRPLSQLRMVWLLVGTREGPIGALGSAVRVLDLDNPRFIQRADIAEYVLQRLLARDDPESLTPYRSVPKVAEAVAEAVAETAYPIFLVARLICEELIQREVPLDIQKSDWKAGLPRTVGDAFEEYLKRFGSQEDRVRDLLRPLAYAEGAGLPWESLWAPLASRLAGKEYSDSDIDWLRREASSYIVQSAENEHTVYRLYHQALADHLQREGQEAEVHSRFIAILLAQTPRRKAGGEPDWLRAHPYTRVHLATHAARCGRLGEFTSDPLYLICADPDRLLSALNTPGNGAGREESHIYLASFHQVKRSHLPEEVASYLEMAARKAGMESFANAIDVLPLRRSWSILWTRWQVEGTYRVIIGHGGLVASVAIGDWQGRTVIVSGSMDKTVRVWDLATGTQIGKPLKGHDHYVTSVAIGDWQGRTVIVSGSWDKTVRVWDPATGTQIGESLKGHDRYVTSVAIGDWQGRTVIVSGSMDNTVRVWWLDGSKPVVIDVGAVVNGVTMSRHNQVFAATNNGIVCLRVDAGGLMPGG